jgi:hypothetical protein
LARRQAGAQGSGALAEPRIRLRPELDSTPIDVCHELGQPRPSASESPQRAPQLVCAAGQEVAAAGVALRV